MNKYGLKLISGLLLFFCLLNNKVNAQVIEEFYVQEFPFKIDDIIYNYHQHKITDFNIKCIHYFKNKKVERYNYSCAFKQDTILEIKNKKSIYQYVIRNKEFYNLNEIKKEEEINRMKIPMSGDYDVFVKDFDSLGFQYRNVYEIDKSDTILVTQLITKRDSLNRIIFENYQNIHYHHRLILPDRYEKTYYSGDTTIHEYFRKVKNIWQADYRYYYTCNKFDVKNKQLREHKEDCYLKTIYFNNPSKNDEYYGKEIIKYEYDNNGFEKRITQSIQGLYFVGFEGQTTAKVTRKESIILTFTIIK